MFKVFGNFWLPFRFLFALCLSVVFYTNFVGPLYWWTSRAKHIKSIVFTKFLSIFKAFCSLLVACLIFVCLVFGCCFLH